MFGIGEFANLGRVSVRMLRHYDAIGLLRPARVDRSSGYRYYTAAQLNPLNRIVALKELGFTLEQVQTMIGEKVDPAELRGMLRLRRAQLAEQVAADNTRLAQVDARLRMIETAGVLDTAEVVLKSVPAQRVAQLSAPIANYLAADIAPALTPLYPQLINRMEQAGVRMTGAPLAWYERDFSAARDEAAIVYAAFPIAGEPPPDPGFEVYELPALDHAATLLHHGHMDLSFRTGQTIAAWIDANGYRTVGEGYAREIYLDCPPGEYAAWVTELQVEIAVPRM
ncbi:MerR family transcriptional regulator [Actinoplanes sp. NPDC049265]|uniref:MerR family transcriptional regulator n=1 Tax=Actinoplanes sp. NPDC049265 TaxID=3363902 RepID=UPI003717BA56